MPSPPAPDGYRYVQADLFTATDGARLHQHVDGISGAVFEPFMSERDLKIRVVIRQTNPAPMGVRYASKDLVFKKVAGQAKATFSGQMLVPDGPSTNLEIAAVLLSEVPDGEHYLSGVPSTDNLVVRTFNEPPFLTQMEALPNGRKKVRTKMPYIAHWRPISLVDNGRRLEINNGTEGNKECLIFKPSGSLLRFKIKNTLTTQLIARSIKINSNILTNVWGYKFNQGSFTDDPSLIEGHSLSSSGSPQISNQLYPLGGDITLAPSAESGWYYTWVMPQKSGLTPPPGGFRTKIWVVSSTGTEYPAFSSTAQTISKKAIPVILKPSEDNPCGDFPFGMLPLDFVAGHNLARISNAWALQSDNTNPNSLNNQIFTATEVVSFAYSAPASSRTIGNQKYFLPEESDMRSVFPPRTTQLSIPTGSELSHLGPHSERMRVGGPDGGFFIRGNDLGLFDPNYKSYACRTSDGNIYVLRLVGGQNCFVLAYRYKFFGSQVLNPSNAYVEIDSRYVGRQLTSTNPTDVRLFLRNQVITAAFWDRSNGARFSQTVQLPMTGIKERLPNGTERVYRDFAYGRTGAYRLLTQNNNSHFGICTYYFDTRRVETDPHFSMLVPSSNPLKASVRLFKDMTR